MSLMSVRLPSLQTFQPQTIRLRDDLAAKVDEVVFYLFYQP